MKGPGCVLTGANVHAAYTQAMFAEVRHSPPPHFCIFINQVIICIFNSVLLDTFLPHLMKYNFVFCLGGSSDEGKQGGVMVEFDDGDRGKISVPNIRLLPPGYQIHCGCLLSV